MSEIFYAGFIPFYLDDCQCIPGVMGSEDWVAPDEGPLDYDVGGSFYWNSVPNLGPQRMYWPISSGGFQSIQVTVVNFGPRPTPGLDGFGGDILELWCRSIDTATEDAGVQFFARKYEDVPGSPMWSWFILIDEDFIDSGDGPWPYGDLDDPTIFLLESEIGGAYRVKVNGSLLTSGTYVGQPTGTSYVGFSGERDGTATDSATTMHIYDICIKECGSEPEGGGGDPLPGDPEGPEAYGAVGDGTTDDTVALQAALDAGGTVVLVNTYRHTAVLTASVDGTTINGPGTLKATVPGQSALKITGDNITVDGVTLTMPTASSRLGADVTAKLWLSNCDGAIIRNVVIDGSASAGMYMKGASNYLIEDCSVSNTLADTYHNTGGSHDGIIRRCSATNGGDDGFAVVSYQADGVQCYNISIESPRFFGNTWGRGFTCVGGHDVTFTDIYGQDSNAAMIYVATEGSPWFTYPAVNVTFTGGTILRANTNSSIDHGAILATAYNGSNVNSDLTITDIAITNTRSGASRQVGLLVTSGGIIRTTMTNITITGGPSNLLVSDTSSYNTSGWTYNGTPVAPHTGW